MISALQINTDFNILNILIQILLQIIVFNPRMRDNYVSNMQEVLLANQTQKSKIQFLERERIKRDHFLADMQQNLRINKQTLQDLNNNGPNNEVIRLLVKEGNQLVNKLKNYYDEYQNINLMLLIQKQMGLEETHFYNQRIIEFENKIIDLRKYLHDKEDSFSSVITRLKKYEDINQESVEDKLSLFKKEIGERHINQFISEILKQKNYYKAQYQKMSKQYLVFGELRNMLRIKFPDMEEEIKSFEQTKKIEFTKIITNVSNQKVEKEKDKKKSKIQPNKEMIRLLKKEKLNNELLQEALSEAIQKNEELIGIKQVLQSSLTQIEKKYQLLYCQNTIIALRLAEYDHHFCRKHNHNITFYEEGDIQGLKSMLEPRLREYAKSLITFYKNQPKQLQRMYTQKLKWDIQKWAEFICDSDSLKKKLIKKNLLFKSCSMPSLVVGYDIDAQEFVEDADPLFIEQF